MKFIQLQSCLPWLFMINCVGLWMLGLALVAPGWLRAQEDVAETKANHQIDTTPIKQYPITDADRNHWSFAPIQRHPLPATKQPQWQRTAIDAFILAKLEGKDL